MSNVQQYIQGDNLLPTGSRYGRVSRKKVRNGTGADIPAGSIVTVLPQEASPHLLTAELASTSTKGSLYVAVKNIEDGGARAGMVAREGFVDDTTISGGTYGDPIYRQASGGSPGKGTLTDTGSTGLILGFFVKDGLWYFDPAAPS